jgi:hypothetical protein
VFRTWCSIESLRFPVRILGLALCKSFFRRWVGGTRGLHPSPGSLSFSHFLRGGRFAPTGYWGSGSLALTIGFRSRQADVHCDYRTARLFRHALVPSPFRVWVRRMTWQVSHACRLIIRQNYQAVTRRTPLSTISASSSRRNCRNNMSTSCVRVRIRDGLLAFSRQVSGVRRG